LIRWVVNTVALIAASHIIAGVRIDSWETAIIAALFLGMFNATLRPILIVFTLPITIATLGLFTLIVNAFLFYLVSKIVAGFTVAGFWSAFWAALAFSVISFVLNLFVAPTVQYNTRFFRSSGRPPKEPPRGDYIDTEGWVEK